MEKTHFRVVPDTNVVIASEKTTSESSPNREFFNRWRSGQFEILFSDDTLLEYVEKLRALEISEKNIKTFLVAILEAGIHVSIEKYHFPIYPSDVDDIAFILCAENGEATHLVSYDQHLKDVEMFYSFKVCEILDFLFDLRKEIEKIDK